MRTRIAYTKPSITELEIRYATDAASNGWGERCYEYISRFEKTFSEHLGVKYAVATSSCTGALHMGMAGLGIGPGDEVILADTNWVATVSPIVHLGAKPIFVDILSDTWCINPQLAETAITPRTKAIVATHLYGNLCDMGRLLAISEKYGIPIIEDSAEAIGSVWHGRRAGSIGSFGAFSFHGSKTITTGEGGMFVTNDEVLYKTVLTLSNHGREIGQIKQFWPDIMGYKYKMSNIQAAIGCAQVERVKELIARKQQIFYLYRDSLKSIDSLMMNTESAEIENGYWMPTVVFDPHTKITREILLQAFANEEIDARNFFWPLSSLPIFSAQEKNINSYSISKRAINLPSYHDISLAEIEQVVSVIRGLYQ